MMPGPMELVLVLGVALLVFGPKRLPDMGRSIGGGMRSFKEAVSGDAPSAPERLGPGEQPGDQRG